MAGRPVHTFEVVRSEQLTRHMVRVVLGGSGKGTGFDTFTPNDSTDAYVKLVFVDDAVDVDTLEHPLTLDSFKALDPTVRTYTVRRTDPQRREITIDFVVHGDHGVAGPWAASAAPGQRIFVMGPSGAYAPDPAADWHLLAGDEAALPAISAALEA
ncbi:MAG: siderophore-interacting protein, partial [Dietzia sp.]|nr:siderophore-interacting protein [Dietzia sp.]